MEALILVFGMAMGSLLGFGVKENVDYKNCLKLNTQAQCAEMYNIKKGK